MTTVVETIFVLVGGVLGVFVWQELLWDARRRTRRRWLDSKGSSCALHICGYLFDDAPMPTPDNECDHESLLELLHSVCTLTSGYEPRRVALLSRRMGLDDYLQRRTRGRARCTRAVYSLLALQTGIDVDLQLRDTGDDLASQTLFVLSAARLDDTNAAVRHLAARTLSPTSAAMAVEMRSRRFPLSDYSGALHSADPMAVRLGLAAVRRMANPEMTAEVVRLVDTCDDELIEESLYALVALRLPVVRQSVARAVARLGEVRRTRFYRHLVAEGYASSSIELLCRAEPSAVVRDYAISLGESHKRRLDQPQKQTAL